MHLNQIRALIELAYRHGYSNGQESLCTIDCKNIVELLDDEGYQYSEAQIVPSIISKISL